VWRCVSAKVATCAGVGAASWVKNALANLKLPFGDGVRRRAWLSNRHGRLMTPPDD
jgi:hypothetical protein